MVAADKFERLLAAGLGPQANNKVFEQIGTYVRAISQAEVANACLQRYLAVYRTYENQGNRSRGDMAFRLVLERVLQVSKPTQLDALFEALTSAAQPPSPLKRRFDALAKSDRDEILQLAKAPQQARKEVSGVLTELLDAFRRTHNQQSPKDGRELMSFEPLGRDEAFHTEYELRLGMLRTSYDTIAQGRDTLPGLDLASQCGAFWEFVRAQRRDGLRLFQLLYYWRQDRIDGHSKNPSTYVEQIAYIQIAAGLLSYALATKEYPANIRLDSFTADEWKFVLAPLRGSTYEDTYDAALQAFPAHASTFAQQCEMLLRLLAFARYKGMSLATNAELRRVAEASATQAREVVARLRAGSIASYQAPSFAVTRKPNQRDSGTGTYRVGDEIAETFHIVYFEGSPPLAIYVEFNDIPCVLFSMSPGVFEKFAKDAVFVLVRKYTAPLLILIPLFWQVVLAIPGVVHGGFIGLVRALLSPVEMEAAASALEQFGLDGDQAGWWLLAGSLLMHRVRSSINGLETRGLADPAIKQRAISESKIDLAEYRHAAKTNAAIGKEELAASELADATDDEGAVANQNVAAGAGRGDPVIPTPRFPASENAMIRGTATAANDNRLTGPGIAELEAFAADAEQAQQVASEIAELEWQRLQMEAEQLGQVEAEELAGRAVASGRGGGRGSTRPSRGNVRTGNDRGTSQKGTGGPLPKSKPKPPAAMPRTVLKKANAKIRGLSPKTKQWLEDIATEWRKQSERFKKVKGISDIERGRRAHAATQRAMKKLHPDATVAEEAHEVRTSRVPRRGDIGQPPDIGEDVVGEFKPWAYIDPDNGGLITSRVARQDGVETLQIQAYGILDREVGRPVFVFTADGKVYSPTSTSWEIVGESE